MNPPHLIALDLDGTLLDEQAGLTERSRLAVRRAARAGATVVICTGRPPRMTHALAEALELEMSIVYNGASRIHHTDGTVVHHHRLGADEAAVVVARLREQVDGVHLGLETPQGWFLDEPFFQAGRARLEARGMPLPDGVGPIEDFLSKGAIKIFARHPERSVPAMATTVEDLPVYVTWSGPGLLEIMHPDVNKRDALERLSAELGIEREAVAAFGDNHNDVEMLAWAGRGVATANASAEARNAADEVTAAHHEHGVAVVLERWF